MSKKFAEIYDAPQKMFAILDTKKQNVKDLLQPANR